MRATFYWPFAVLAAAAAAAHAEPGGFFPDVLAYLAGCGPTDFDVCLARTIDGVMENANGTYRLNRYLTVELHRAENNLRPGDGEGGDLAARALRFFNALRVQYRPEDADRNFEGRKKKFKGTKHKMGEILGAASMGMTVVNGMTTKMMMGAVMMIATKALLIAKLALALASIIALKKVFGGGGGGGGGGGVLQYGGGIPPEHGGYSRSYDLPPPNQKPGAKDAALAMAYRDQPVGPYNNDNSGWQSQYPQ